MTPAAWLAPTARAVPWQPLAGVAACLVVVCALAAALDSWPVGVLDVAAAGLAAAVVAGLRDTAEDLLSAMPTSAATRRTRRQVLLVPAGLAVWLAYLGAGHLWAPELGWPIGAFVALVATGSAVAVWAPRRVAVEAGVAAPLLWLALARVGTALDPQYAHVVFAFEHHPWIVTAAAVTATLMGRNR
ncbi:MAG TPA: hypothetical protein VLQ78_10205 [Ornithinibacter sp.]|nr:hypothetical protein [Ornithinibacter sp.]